MMINKKILYLSMNIELRFLQKVVNDRNFVEFTYENKQYKNMKALSLEDKNNNYKLQTNEGLFEFKKIKSLKILKNKF